MYPYVLKSQGHIATLLFCIPLHLKLNFKEIIKQRKYNKKKKLTITHTHTK